MKQIHMYVLDLTKIGGDGDFPCPECGTIISPDDCDEESYSILDINVNTQGLEELVVCCKKCASQLHLTGFSLLQKQEKPKQVKRDETSYYIAHV